MPSGKVFNRMPRGTDKINIQLPPVDKPELQKTHGPLQSIGPSLNFAGIDNVNGRIPADPNGDVSPLYYMQTVNRSFAVWDKAGNLVYGPVDNASIWEGFEGPWNNTSWGGDPVFKYDQFAGPDTTIFIGESITLQGEVAYSYDHFWSTPGDGVFSDITSLNAIYTPGTTDTTNREVILVLTANEVSPCTENAMDSLTLTLDTTTGVNALVFQELNVQIVPNPTSGLINIHIKTTKETALTLNVLNSSGKQLFTGNFKTTNNQFDQQFDFSYLTNGIYFIRIYCQSMQKTVKIIKKE